MITDVEIAMQEVKAAQTAYDEAASIAQREFEREVAKPKQLLGGLKKKLAHALMD